MYSWIFMENFDVFVDADSFALCQADEIADKLRAGDEDYEEESLKGEFGVMGKVEGGGDEMGSSSEEEWCRLMRKGRGDEFRGGEKDKKIKHERYMKFTVICGLIRVLEKGDEKQLMRDVICGCLTRFTI
jgi:hypothetical protein